MRDEEVELVNAEKKNIEGRGKFVCEVAKVNPRFSLGWKWFVVGSH